MHIRPVRQWPCRRRDASSHDRIRRRLLVKLSLQIIIAEIIRQRPYQSGGAGTPDRVANTAVANPEARPDPAFR